MTGESYYNKFIIHTSDKSSLYKLRLILILSNALIQCTYNKLINAFSEDSFSIVDMPSIY